MATPSQPLLPPLWINGPDAERRIAMSRQPDWVKEAATTLARDGLVVIRGVQPVALCEQVIRDYEDYCTKNRRYVAQNLDDLGREKRLVNFHRTSRAALQLGLNRRIMELLDFVFGSEAGIYTSLTFKYGTQQPVHRDTPHFATWPNGYFTGCWTALRDVSPVAGPLFYYKGAHRQKLEAAPFHEAALAQHPDASPADVLLQALELYNGEVIRKASEWGTRVVPELAQGDVVIWHPETPHGGLPAEDTSATRWSVVYHCAPKAVQVHQHDAFFSHRGDAPPKARYGYQQVDGRTVGVTGDTAFM